MTRSLAKVDTRRIDYSGYALRYDHRRFSGRTNQYLEGVRRRGLARAVEGLAPAMPILDVGCGTGRGICDLRDLGFTSVTGLDYTDGMIRQAAGKLRAAGIERLRLLRGDAFRLPFPDGAFAAVVSLNFLHMFRFDLQQELAAEMTRVCAPGGTVVLELESIHKGLVVTRYLEQRRYRTRTKFNSAREAHRLLPPGAFTRVRVVGTVLPVAYKAFQYAPALGFAVEAVTHVPPFNWIAARVLVVGRRGLSASP